MLFLLFYLFWCLLSFTFVTFVLLQEAFSLVAYVDPWSCPANHLLDAQGREIVCNELNGAILSKSPFGFC